MSMYLLSLLRQGRLEVLSRRTINGDTSKVFLLGTIHRTKESRIHARTLVDLLRPDTLFLELDQDRASRMDNYPDSEFTVARDAARRYGINTVYGDYDFEGTHAMLKEREDELMKLHPLLPREAIVFQARIDIKLNFRNRHMVDGLLKLDQSSILGVVGRAHLKGMKDYWEQKTGIPQDTLSNLASD